MSTMSDELRQYAAAFRFCTGNFSVQDNIYTKNESTDKSWERSTTHDIKTLDPYVACRAMLDSCGIGADVKHVEFVGRMGEECAIYVKEALTDKVCVEAAGENLVIRGCNLCEVFDLLYKDAHIYNKLCYDYFRNVKYLA